MSATGTHCQLHIVGQLLHIRQDCRGHERIIVSLDDQRRLQDVTKIAKGARLPVIIVGISKTVDRCGEAVIELTKGACFFDLLRC